MTVMLTPTLEPEKSALAEDLACEILPHLTNTEQFRTAWDEAVLRLGGSVYMTFDWVRIWWAFYGENDGLRVFVFRKGGRIVALVPLYVDSLGVAPAKVRIAKLVGANIPPKVFDPPIEPGHACEVLARVFGHMLERESCDVVSMGPLSETIRWTESVRIACEAHSDLISRCDVASGLHSIFHLPEHIDRYYEGLSKNERSHRRKYDLRLMKKDYDVHVDVVSAPDTALEEFERFAEQHRRQWLAEGKPGHFGSWPQALEFNRALVEAHARLGRVRFIRIVADEQVIASQYVFVFGGQYYWELPSREVDPKWGRFSLGPTGIVNMLAVGIQEGIGHVQGGLAHYDYKVRLGAKEYKTFTFRVIRSGLTARVRVALLSLLKQGAGFLYHKMWYRRVAPRLPPMFWRAQPAWWLRLDF